MLNVVKGFHWEKVESLVDYCTPWDSLEDMFGWDDAAFYRKEAVIVRVYGGLSSKQESWLKSCGICGTQTVSKLFQRMSKNLKFCLVWAKGLFFCQRTDLPTSIGIKYLVCA